MSRALVPADDDRPRIGLRARERREERGEALAFESRSDMENDIRIRGNAELLSTALRISVSFSGAVAKRAAISLRTISELQITAFKRFAVKSARSAARR